MNFDLDRFVAAQDPVYASVIEELRAGDKTSHWMWFVFPQLRGLGRSAMAAHYGIASREEALAYLAHPVLGSRLRECTDCLMAHAGRSALSILGSPDDMKLRSCLTLFAAVAAPGTTLFREALDAFFEGMPDDATLSLLGSR